MYESKRYLVHDAAIVYAIHMRDGSIPSHSIDVDREFYRYSPTHQTSKRKKNDFSNIRVFLELFKKKSNIYSCKF